MLRDGSASGVKPMQARHRRALRVAFGLLVAPLTVGVLLLAYRAATGATVAGGFIAFCVATGYAAALLLGLPLHLFVLGRGRRRGPVTYAVAGAVIGLVAYAAIAAILSIHAIVTLALGDFGYFLYLSRHFAALGVICGAASALVFWGVAVRGWSR